MSVVEVAGIEPAPPNGLQLYDIINKYYTTKIPNGTGVMGQYFFNQLTLKLIQKLYRRKLQPILQTLLQVV